ncbi:bifunctional glycosyltransferase family 2/GtrA family protein [Paenibacillus methanolicus]|uniref:Putative flippase GtrA n=1 Tax=Paenibacillus methanolicus TaxID=582686 RepID=A0A5S5CDC9_9BACL|nr:bifunctional glycosyltransferase family 2/GtrA family protein [Paenibacillus methanolicus]TYP76360.1 putative flippase GtrA [Paenibacillus methanolicus]
MTILIPAYEPDQRLLTLVDHLKETCWHRIVLVDDGSGPVYAHIFDAARDAGCTVLTHNVNRGKGRALKTGFGYLKEIGETEGVICADSDGQHLPADIMRIADVLASQRSGIVLGCRHFTGKVPLRSRFGNSTTRLVYALTTGNRIQDTQTGLRGFPASMLDWLCELPGERFEYEMNMLLKAQEDGYPMREVTIDTVYLENNKSSHFRPIADSAKVYAPILKFCSSSLMSALLDFGLLMLLQLLTGKLLFSVIGARTASSIFNYSMNRRFVFDKNKKSAVFASMPKYFALVVLIMVLNYGLMHLFHESWGIPLAIAKLLTEGALFLFSYWSQRKFVFAAPKETAGKTCSGTIERVKHV